MVSTHIGYALLMKPCPCLRATNKYNHLIALGYGVTNYFHAFDWFDFLGPQISSSSTVNSPFNLLT